MQPGSTGADTHALNYIAFYLGEIEQHLATIARVLDRSAPNVEQQLQALNCLVGGGSQR